MAQALQGDPREWEKGTPVRISMDVDELTEEDQTLLTAYRSLDVPVEGNLPENLPPLVSVEQARMTLFAKSKEKATTTEILKEDLLPDNDDDALDYAYIQPDHDAQGLNADGRLKTRVERREEAEEAAAFEYMVDREEAAASREEPAAMEVDPAPPYSPPEPGSNEPFGTSALQVTLTEMSSNTGTPLQTLTPVSAVTSIPSSEGASVNSSTSASSAQPGQQQRRSTVAAQHSRNWRGRHRQPPASSSCSQPAHYRSPSPRRHSPSPRHSPFPHRRSPSPRQYSPPHHQSSSWRRPASPQRRYPSLHCRSPSPNHYVRHGSPPRSVAMAIYTQGMLAGLPSGATVVQAQQQQQLVHETDSGILASMSVLSFSASRNAIPIPATSGRQGYSSSTPSSAYTSGCIENVQETSSSHYRQQSRSPPREHRPQHRVSPPCEFRQGPRRYLPPRNPQRAPPVNREAWRGYKRDPFPAATAAWSAANEGPALWGETSSAFTPEIIAPAISASTDNLAAAPPPPVVRSSAPASSTPSAPAPATPSAPSAVPPVSVIVIPPTTAITSPSTAPPLPAPMASPSSAALRASVPPASPTPVPAAMKALPHASAGRSKADSSAPGPSSSNKT